MVVVGPEECRPWPKTDTQVMTTNGTSVVWRENHTVYTFRATTAISVRERYNLVFNVSLCQTVSICIH